VLAAARPLPSLFNPSLVSSATLKRIIYKCRGEDMRKLSHTVLLLVLIANMILPRPLLALAEPNITNVIDDILNQIEIAIEHVANRIVSLVKHIARPIAMALFAVGIVLWATGINSGRGKQLILGGIILLAVAEML